MRLRPDPCLRVRLPPRPLSDPPPAEQLRWRSGDGRGGLPRPPGRPPGRRVVVPRREHCLAVRDGTRRVPGANRRSITKSLHPRPLAAALGPARASTSNGPCVGPARASTRPWAGPARTEYGPCVGPAKTSTCPSAGPATTSNAPVVRSAPVAGGRELRRQGKRLMADGSGRRRVGPSRTGSPLRLETVRAARPARTSGRTRTRHGGGWP